VDVQKYFWCWGFMVWSDVFWPWLRTTGEASETSDDHPLQPHCHSLFILWGLIEFTRIEVV
jgi:hypothetical protein